MEGPVLIASNHPNSFLDAIVMASLFKQPVYSLTRGDVFKKKFYDRLLRSLHMMPVYRISEGAENLEHNYSTFDFCKAIFKQKGIVLIFSEGSCVNEWKLRPLKKGTARLALSCWEEGIPVKVLPTGINYNSFRSFGKNIKLNFGNIIEASTIDKHDGHGKSIAAFNQKLEEELRSLVIDIDTKNTAEIKNQFAIKQPLLKKILLGLPAVAGAILFFPLYYPIQHTIWKKAVKTGHYDAIVVGLLFILSPVYLLLLCIVLYWLTHSMWSFLLFLIAPFLAWSYVQLKKQF